MDASRKRKKRMSKELTKILLNRELTLLEMEVIVNKTGIRFSLGGDKRIVDELGLMSLCEEFSADIDEVVKKYGDKFSEKISQYLQKSLVEEGDVDRLLQGIEMLEKLIEEYKREG